MTDGWRVVRTLIRVLREKSDRILDGPSGQVVPVLFMGGYGNALWQSDGKTQEMTRHARQGVVFPLVLLLTGCDLFSMEQVPSADLIKEWLGPFLVEADQIKGIYRNLDVDSVVFTYRTAMATEQAFAEGLARNLATSRWQRQSHTTAFIEYRRRFAKGETGQERPDMPIFASREVIRLSFSPADRTVVVAYVQADASHDSDSFEDSGEGTWAGKTIWPEFDALRHR